jgi:hypothetical protein
MRSSQFPISGKYPSTNSLHGIAELVILAFEANMDNDDLGLVEASRVFRRFQVIRRSLDYEQDIEQIFA